MDSRSTSEPPAFPVTDWRDVRIVCNLFLLPMLEPFLDFLRLEPRESTLSLSNKLHLSLDTTPRLAENLLFSISNSKRNRGNDLPNERVGTRGGKSSIEFSSDLFSARPLS